MIRTAWRALLSTPGDRPKGNSRIDNDYAPRDTREIIGVSKPALCQGRMALSAHMQQTLGNIIQADKAEAHICYRER